MVAAAVDQGQLQVELLEDPLGRIEASAGIQPLAETIAIEIRPGVGPVQRGRCGRVRCGRCPAR